MGDISIVGFGNLGEGYTFYGPFADFDEASSWLAKQEDEYSWIATLNDPDTPRSQ